MVVVVGLFGNFVVNGVWEFVFWGFWEFGGGFEDWGFFKYCFKLIDVMLGREGIDIFYIWKIICFGVKLKLFYIFMIRGGVCVWVWGG